MVNPEHLNILKQGVETWNQWREEHPEIEPDLQEADLVDIHLEGACLSGARLVSAHLKGAHLKRAYLKKADLRGAHLERADLREAHLEEARLAGAYLQEARLTRASLEKAYLKDTHLEKAHLWSVHLEGARLPGAHLEGADLWDAHLGGAHLLGTHLEGADLSHASFDSHSLLEGLTLQDNQHGSASLADVKWNGANLAVIRWEHLIVLGEEQTAHQPTTLDGKGKDKDRRLREYQRAVRANRQLAVTLRDQGLNEEADRFAYRSQRLKRILLRRQALLANTKLQKTSLRQRLRALSGYLFSLLLDVLAGYGYKPGLSVLWYLLVIFGFAWMYHTFGHLPLWPPDAFVYSLTSFHGRGFFPGLPKNQSLHDPLVMFAALEAVIGLLIEVSFIATFTQRYFGR